MILATTDDSPPEDNVKHNHVAWLRPVEVEVEVLLPVEVFFRISLGLAMGLAQYGRLWRVGG